MTGFPQVPHTVLDTTDVVEEAGIVIPELFGMSTLIARVDPGNVPSARILVRRGFIRGASEAGLDQCARKNT
ncbi:hypothetical protein ACX80H_00375 [Arthrobacter sp. MDT2-2]